MSKTFGVRFISEKDPVSDLIMWESHGIYSHVDLIDESGWYIGARAAGGVARRAPDYIPQAHILREARYELPCSDEAFKAGWDFANAQIGKSYDFEAIVGIAAHTGWHSSEDKWFCSYLAIAALNAAGFRVLNVEPEYYRIVTPELLHLSPVFEGRRTYFYQIPK